MFFLLVPMEGSGLHCFPPDGFASTGVVCFFLFVTAMANQGFLVRHSRS